MMTKDCPWEVELSSCTFAFGQKLHLLVIIIIIIITPAFLLASCNKGHQDILIKMSKSDFTLIYHY